MTDKQICVRGVPLPKAHSPPLRPISEGIMESLASASAGDAE